MDKRFVTVDGNEVAARMAHLTNEVIAIDPITPASPMGEYSDAWSAAGRVNIHGTVPHVIETRSEAGAAGAAHGSLQAGADVTMLASALYRHGPGHRRLLLDGARRWLEEHAYESVRQMRGSLSWAKAPDPAAFERANDGKTLAECSGKEPVALLTEPGDGEGSHPR